MKSFIPDSPCAECGSLPLPQPYFLSGRLALNCIARKVEADEPLGEREKAVILQALARADMHQCLRFCKN